MDVDKIDIAFGLQILSVLALSTLVLRQSEGVLPRAKKAGFGAFNQTWSAGKPARRLLNLLLATVEGWSLFVLLPVLFQRWSTALALGLLLLSMAPWMLLLLAAEAPARRLSLAYQQRAFHDYRRVLRTSGGLWLLKLMLWTMLLLR